LEFPFSITASLELSSAADDVENILTGLYWFCASTEKTDSFWKSSRWIECFWTVYVNYQDNVIEDAFITW